MPGSVFDSLLYGRLFQAGEVGRLFTDTAEIRAMLLVEGALARAQGGLGVIPETAATQIHRAAMEAQIDPAALAEATGTNGVSVPALVAAFREAIPAPEARPHVHWGATSQDIADTGLMLRLRQALTLIEADVIATLQALGRLATDHAETPMAARTYGQHATPTAFGAVVAGWGAPLLDLLDELPALRDSCLLVSLSGAAGTSAALGDSAPQIRAALAQSLALRDPGRSWHTDRGPVLRIADWLTRLSLALGKMGEDLTLHAQSDLGEIRLGGAGGSSTMPQKQNPVGPSVLVALARQATALHGALQAAGMQRYQRDGAAWFTEWMALPQLVLGAAAGAGTALRLAGSLAPDTAAMARVFDGPGQMMMAEALSFALARTMPRPEAQAAVKALCREATASGRPLAEVAAGQYPDLPGDLFDPRTQMGQAPEEARAFSRRAATATGKKD
ncbi:lyase family protein [Marinibacterium sp. SX1]|uniref:lyase family protein n=1 Tax=Marinibacterium sp. SX1 TaxID=3388424 RepID=UPI003D176499